MGIRQTKIAASPEDKRNHKEAEKALKEAKAQRRSQVKVLLLGCGDSGKSTILKQMRLIHRVPFTRQEIESYRQLVFTNITEGMKVLVDALADMDLAVEHEHVPALEMLERTPDVRDHEPFPPAYLEPLKALWMDAGVQAGWERGNEAAVPENLSYFYRDLDRLFDPAYLPTQQDIVHCRARTTGITETMFHMRNHEMLMVDVGGQRSERRKWIHCFDDVTCVLFLVSLSGYDQCLVEDKHINQMQDAMTTWKSTCQSTTFSKTSFVLFLNKDDLFEQKIRHSHIRNVFPDYNGPDCDTSAGREYFRRRFLKLFVRKPEQPGINPDRQLYVHYTTATDTEPLRMVMNAIEDIIINHHIRTLLL